MKFVVDETDQVSQLRQAVADAGRVAGMRSAYSQDTAWTVTVLEGWPTATCSPASSGLGRST